MRRHLLRVGLLLALTGAAPASAHAQPRSSGLGSTRGTDLGVFVGASASPEGTDLDLAGIAGWQMTRWIAIEGRGAWVLRRPDDDAFSADLSALVNVVPRQPITPYVGAGLGLYHTAFASADSPMSGFYRRRIGFREGPARSWSFTDPALRLTAGLDVTTRRHLTIRPEVSALVVWRGGHSQAMTIVGVRFGYRFEDRPVTPTR